MEKITYGKTATSKIAAILKSIDAKKGKRSFTVQEGAESKATATWDKLVYKKSSDIPQEEAEVFRAAKETKHPLFFGEKPYLVAIVDSPKSQAQKEIVAGIEALDMGVVTTAFWQQDYEMLQRIGKAALESKPEPKKAVVKKAAAKPEPKSKAWGGLEKSVKVDPPKKEPKFPGSPVVSTDGGKTFTPIKTEKVTKPVVKKAQGKVAAKPRKKVVIKSTAKPTVRVKARTGSKKTTTKK